MYSLVRKNAAYKDGRFGGNLINEQKINGFRRFLD